MSLITLGVADLGRAKAFYQALGWTSGASPADDVAFFQAGGMISFLTVSRCWRPLPRSSSRAGRGRADPARGAKTFWGGYSGVFVDPDGHPWEVAHNPYWTLADDGSVRLAS